MKYIFFILLTALSAHGEYRAYQYMIKMKNSETPSQIVTSSLNPTAYLAYNGREYLQLDLLRTWICPGFTGFKRPICKSPYQLMNEKVQ